MNNTMNMNAEIYAGKDYAYLMQWDGSTIWAKDLYELSSACLAAGIDLNGIDVTIEKEVYDKLAYNV
jgi:hypothetical protein